MLPSRELPRDVDVVVVGGGQTALAVGYHLKRLQRNSNFRFVILDAGSEPGGAWVHGWDSLRLFSPAEWSSLPGWPLPRAQAERYVDRSAPEYPGRDDVIAYLTAYEQRYELPVVRPVQVLAVRRASGAASHETAAEISYCLSVETVHGPIIARAVISATGTWSRPYIPTLTGGEHYTGLQLHSAHYVSPSPFIGRRVLVVGGGNSGAQIAAEVSEHARVSWVTLEAPAYLPEHVDGRVLFNQATARYAAIKAGQPPPPAYSLGNVVQVESVRSALASGRLNDVRQLPLRFTTTGVVWEDGIDEPIDAVIWCTGFRPALDHLAMLGIVQDDSRVQVNGTRSVREPKLWLVGYGEWTGFASATLVGVGRTAKSTAEQVVADVARETALP